MNHFLSIFLYLLNPFCHIITFYMHKRNEGKAVKCYLFFSLTEVHSGHMCAYGHSSLLFVCVCVWQPCTALCDFSISPGGGSVKRPPPGPSKA